jgi:aryl-alcohol dehydrogenase-like predicted oxidoreductase
MESRFLGRTGMRVSALALGTLTFGGEADAATAGAIFARCRDAGVDFFDTADVYNAGRAEEILGRMVAPCRNDIVLATKAYFPSGPGPNQRGSSRYHLVRAVEASLRRLDTDRVDVLYLHRFDEQTALEETLRALDDLVRAGKVLYPAVSNFSAWQTARALGVCERAGWAPPVCVQPMYNLAKRQVESEILPMCAALGLGVVAYGPLGGGLLSGKYGMHARPESGRLVDVPMYATRYGAATNFEIASRFVAFARELGIHPATLAIAWVASHPAVTATLIGARSVEQIEPCLAASELAMTAELRAEIDALSPAPSAATDRNEEVTKDNYGAR